MAYSSPARNALTARLQDGTGVCEAAQEKIAAHCKRNVRIKVSRPTFCSQNSSLTRKQRSLSVEYECKEASLSSMNAIERWSVTRVNVCLESKRDHFWQLQ